MGFKLSNNNTYKYEDWGGFRVLRTLGMLLNALIQILPLNMTRHLCLELAKIIYAAAL